MQGAKIDVVTLESLFSRDLDGVLPILLTVKHKSIIWKDDEFEQENGEIRLVNTNTAVVYGGKKYLPCSFKYIKPSSDGKTIAGTSVTVSSLDQRIIEIIRKLKSDPIIEIESCFMKIDNSKYVFKRIGHFEFIAENTTWDNVTAQFSLTINPIMGKNVPISSGTITRCPAAQ